MADVSDYLANRPYGLDCNALRGLGIDLENVAGGLVDLINTLTLNPTSRYPGKLDARLTLESGVPVSTTDQSAKNTLYFTPFDGDVVPLYDLTEADFVDRYLASEKNVSLVGLGANTVHDVFANYDTGASDIVLSLEPWATPTTRNIPLTTFRGVKVKSGALTHRYLGSLRINATGGQCEDTMLQRFLWNMYHRRRREMVIQIEVNNWSWPTDAWRASNNDPTLRVEFVIGLDEDTIDAIFRQNIFGSTAAIANGIGLDSTTSNVAQQYGSYNQANGNDTLSFYEGHSGVGYHYLQCLERGQTGASFVGNNGTPTRMQAAMKANLFN